MPFAIRLDRDGAVTGPPRKSKAFRVYVEGGWSAGYPITGDGLRVLRDDPDARATFAACALDFRAWLDVWQYVAEGSGPQMLGATLWPGQEQALDAMLTHPFLFALKGRQVGLTTLGVAWDGWVGRPRVRWFLLTSVFLRLPFWDTRVSEKRPLGLGLAQRAGRRRAALGAGQPGGAGGRGGRARARRRRGGQTRGLLQASARARLAGAHGERARLPAPPSA
jgi:hypothetical protein